MQLIDCELHWRFEHLRAHVEDKTRLNNTSRHVCDLLGHEFKILVGSASLLCCDAHREAGRYERTRSGFGETLSANVAISAAAGLLYSAR